MSVTFDLTMPDLAYMFGFLQADGHLSQRGIGLKGQLQVEIQAQDRVVLEAFQRLVPAYSAISVRTRNTNFKQEAESATWKVYDHETRQALNLLGLPYGKKSLTVSPPSVPFSEVDYFRGILDADGAIGVSTGGLPFVTWCTKSPAWSRAILDFIQHTTGLEKVCNPNKRDNCYNISVFREPAQILARTLYYEGCLALPRKVLKARKVDEWVRPETMRKVTWEKRKWTAAEDAFILDHSVEEAMFVLGRTAQSIGMRRHRMR
jgi:hypothetical protein